MAMRGSARAMLTLCVVQLLLATSAAIQQTSVVSPARMSASSRTAAVRLSATSVVSPARPARSELLELLGPRASLAPVPITGRIAELVEELEQAAMVPATPSFLAFGLNGRWQLRALQGPEDLEPAAGPPSTHSPAAAHQLPHNTPHRKPSSTAALSRALFPSPSPSPEPPAPSPHRPQARLSPAWAWMRASSCTSSTR